MPFAPIRLFPAIVLAVAAQHALAQSSGGVSLDISEVSEGIAKRMGVDESRMPMSILVPVDVAAAACGVPRETLSPQGARGGGNCTAKQPVPQIDAILHERILQNEAVGGPPSSSPSASPAAPSTSSPNTPPEAPGRPMPAEKVKP
jgi:hypothetical protein